MNSPIVWGIWCKSNQIFARSQIERVVFYAKITIHIISFIQKPMMVCTIIQYRPHFIPKPITSRRKNFINETALLNRGIQIECGKFNRWQFHIKRNRFIINQIQIKIVPNIAVSFQNRLHLRIIVDESLHLLHFLIRQVAVEVRGILLYADMWQVLNHHIPPF